MTFYIPLVVILKAAPLTPLVGGLPLTCAGGVTRGGDGTRGEGGRGVRRFAGGGGERQASRLPPLRLEVGLSLRFRASLWKEN